MDSKNSGPIWERYIEFEQRFGDLKALKEAERRLCNAMEYPGRLTLLIDSTVFALVSVFLDVRTSYVTGMMTSCASERSPIPNYRELFHTSAMPKLLLHLVMFYQTRSSVRLRKEISISVQFEL